MPVGKEMIRYEDEDNEWEETEATGQVRHLHKFYLELKIDTICKEASGLSYA